MGPGSEEFALEQSYLSLNYRQGGAEFMGQVVQGLVFGLQLDLFGFFLSLDENITSFCLESLLGLFLQLVVDGKANATSDQQADHPDYDW